MPKSSLLTLINSCNRVDLAEKYFPRAAAYLPRDHPNGIFKVLDDFDYKSIMVYSSDFDMIPGSNRFPLLTSGGDRIYTAGHQDPRRAGLSPRDIERVKALYTPVHIPQQEAASAPPAPSAVQGKRVSKRWHSVPFNQDAQPGQPRAWPLENDGYTYITYCYEDIACSGALAGFVAQAHTIWSEALCGSSVIFVPDSACGSETEPCLCTTNDISEASVHLMLATKGVKWPSATLGYRDLTLPRADPQMPRHHILWPANAYQFIARGPLLMAQQLGERHRQEMAKNDVAIMRR